jgi:hypothetical protein
MNLEATRTRTLPLAAIPLITEACTTRADDRSPSTEGNRPPLPTLSIRPHSRGMNLEHTRATGPTTNPVSPFRNRSATTFDSPLSKRPTAHYCVFLKFLFLFHIWEREKKVRSGRSPTHNELKQEKCVSCGLSANEDLRRITIRNADPLTPRASEKEKS